jgi:hypothetical protein
MSDDGKRGIYINCEPGRDELAHSKAHRRRAGNAVDILLYINSN